MINTIEMRFDTTMTRHNQNTCAVSYDVRFVTNLIVKDVMIDFLDSKMVLIIENFLNTYWNGRTMIWCNDPDYKHIVDEAYKSLNGCSNVEEAPIKAIDLVDLDDVGFGTYVTEYNMFKVNISEEVREANKNNPIIDMLDKLTITNFEMTKTKLARWMYKFAHRHYLCVRNLADDELFRAVSRLAVGGASYRENSKIAASYDDSLPLLY